MKCGKQSTAGEDPLNRESVKNNFLKNIKSGGVRDSSDGEGGRGGIIGRQRASTILMRLPVYFYPCAGDLMRSFTQKTAGGFRVRFIAGRLLSQPQQPSAQ